MSLGSFKISRKLLRPERKLAAGSEVAKSKFQRREIDEIFENPLGKLFLA